MNVNKFGRHLIVGVTHQTNTDKFGRHVSTSGKGSADDSLSHIRSIGIPLTSDGQYNIEDKRLSNVHAPINDLDCANKAYVDKTLQDIHIVIKNASSFNIVCLAADIHTLRAELERLQKEHVLSFDGLTRSVDMIEQLFNKYEKHVSTLEKTQASYKAELDAVELKRYSTDTHLEQRIDDLVRSYDLSIVNLHSKIKSLENLVRP